MPVPDPKETFYRALQTGIVSLLKAGSAAADSLLEDAENVLGEATGRVKRTRANIKRPKKKKTRTVEVEVDDGEE